MQQEVGLGAVESIEEVEIRWPGRGTRQRFEDVKPNRVYRVVEGEAELETITLPLLRLGSGDTRAHPHQHGAYAPFAR